MIRRVFAYIRYFRTEFVLNIFFNILSVLFNLFSFVMIVPFVELLFGLSEPPAVQPEFAFSQSVMTAWMTWHLYNYKATLGAWKCLFLVSAGYIGGNFLSNLTRYLGSFFLSPIRNGVLCRLRDDFYHKITILPVSYFNSRRKGDILSRLSNDLFDVEWSIVTSLEMLIKAPVNIVFFAATLVFISPKLFLYFLLILPVAVFLIGRIGKSLKRNSTKGQTKLGGLFSVLEESLAGVRVIKSFGKEARSAQKFEEVNADYSRTMVKVARRKELSSPLSEILGTLGLVVILIIGGSLVMNGEMASSVFIFFVIIFARLIPPVQQVVKGYNNLQKGSASATRIFEVIDADEQIVEKENPTIIEQFEQEVEYRDVSFSYQNDEGQAVPVLQHINLTIPKGKSVALVGPSGAGKTTMADLLPRFYDCSEGEIMIDGTPIKDLQINSLRALTGIVSQNCILFNDSVANNIAFGLPDITLDAIVAAAKVANAHEFIENLPQGYNTPIGDRGITLSGGQRQRLSIARAVLKNPEILILDEATSALDTESEHAVQLALEQLLKGRTSIVIAHRLSTIQHADEIVVLEKGKIVECGNHQQLMELGGLYKKLVDMQSFN